jgi:tetratricopeptide (TPR) repeat protein
VPFFLRRCTFLSILSLFATGLTGCQPKISEEEKKLGQDLRRALRQRSYPEGEILARRLLQFDPNKNGVWERLVHAQYGQRDFEGAKETLTQWRQAVREPSLKVDEYTGDIALKQNNPSLALQSWHKVLGADSRHLRVLRKVARTRQAQKHWAESEAAWSAALQVAEDAEALIQRAMCRRCLHHWAEAFADLHRAEELAPDDPLVMRCAKLFARLSKFLAEVQDLDAQLAVSPKDAGLMADRSLLFLRSEDFELALEDSDMAAKLAPWAMRPKLFAGIALNNLGKVNEAEKRSIRKSLRIETLTPEFLDTISRLDSEISAERTNAELYAARAWQLNEIGQPALALQDAETASQLDPKSAAASAEKGYALMKLGRPEKAFEEIQRATSLDSNYATAWQYRGELEMVQKNYTAAIESLTRALSINQTATALQKREACYRQIGWLVKADEDQRALQEMTARELR